MRKALIAAAGIVVLVVAAVLIVPSFINWNAYKADIVALAEEATGRRLAIDGDINLRLLPSPALRVSNVRLANPQGAADADLVSLASLEVQAAFWPLLRRELQVRSVRVREPRIALEVLADGTATWEFTPQPKDDEPAGAVGNGRGGAIAGITLEEFVIEGGRLTFRDAASGFTEQIVSLDATLSAQELTTGPYEARGELVARGMDLRFAFRVGDLSASEPIPVEATLGFDGAGVSIVLRGLISEAGPDAQLTGRIEATGDDLRAAIAALARAAETDAPIAVPGAQPFSLRAAVDGSRTDISINDIELALGDTRANGAVSIALGDDTAVDAALSFGRIDLDAWLGTAALDSDGADEEGVAPAAGDAAPGGLSLPVIPGDVTGSMTLSTEALTFRGDAIRQVEFSATVGAGALKINRFSALLPGGSDLVVAGSLAAAGGQPQFDGTLEIASDDLRSLLSWLGTDIDQVPSDRLRKFSLQSSVRLTDELVQVFGIDMRLDSTRLTGGAAYALRARPSFSVDLDLDRVNLDAYLGSPDEAGEETPITETSPDDATGGATNGATGGGFGVLAVLNEFDANVALSLETLIFRDERFDGVRLDGSLIGGALALREGRIGDAAGASVSFDGTAGNFAGPVEFATNISISADDPSGLLRLLEADAILPGGALGPLDVSGAVSGTPEDIALDLQVRLGATRANVSGTLALAAAQEHIDVSVGVLNGSLADFAGVLGVPLTPVTPELDGPLSVAGTVKGDIESLTVDLRAVAAGAEIGVAGVIGDVTGVPEFNLALSATHPNLAEFLRALGVDYRPAASNLGAFGLSADIAGGAQALQISALGSRIGPVNVLGDATLALDGPRPRLTAALTASEVLVDLFLPRAADTAPASAGNVGPSKSGPPSRWSSDPLDFSILRAVDGEIELAARGLTYGAYRFEDPSLTLRLTDGVLDIDPLRGVLFDGDVSLRVRVEEGPALGVALNIALSGADIERALIESAGLDQVTGRFDLMGDLATAGSSQREMISKLGGTLRFAARDGVLRGVALGPLSDRLKELNQALDLLALVQTSMSGGETPYTVFQGSFNVADGIARSNDLSAVMEAAAGTGTAVIDLPAWQMDLRTRARLTEHPRAPAIGLDLVGPIDAPEREINSADLEAYLASRVGTTLLRRLLPSDEDGAGTTQTEEGAGDEEPAGALRPRDILRGIMRGIGN